MKNANGEADYYEGFAPTCTAGDGIDCELGDPQEASLAEALYYASHDACSAPPEAARARRAKITVDRRAEGWQSLVNAR